MRPGTILRIARVASCAAVLAGCAHAPRRFPLKEPMWKDTDLAPVSVRCRREPSTSDPQHVSCAPKVRPNPLIWDGLDNLLFRPLSETLAVTGDDGGESVDVNSMDEVPDSAWFTNRIGVHRMTPRELELGRCAPEQILDGATATDGSWVIDHGKLSGATDGFRVTVPGKGRYLFKADDADTADRGSAGQTVGLRVYHAAGYFVPCEQIVYFKPSVFTLRPGLRWKHNFQSEQDFGAKELEHILAESPKRGGLIRMEASAWLPGYNLGGFEFQGTRPDDPSDVVPHESRRELRGKRLLNAWIDRFDDRRGNTMDAWIADRPGAADSSPGHVIHYQLDTSEALGSEYDYEDITRRLGYSYIFDWGDVGTDLATFGARTNVWDTVRKTPGKDAFAYMNVRDFVPEKWKNEYPLGAFSRMTERDGAWMARILARFTPDVVDGLARMADYSNPDDVAYLREVLEGRLEKILQRYLTRLSPIADVHVEGTNEVCAVDLAEWRALRDPSAFRYTARVLGHGWTTVERRAGAELCVLLPHVARDGGVSDDAPSRYVRVRIEDGVARGPLVVHLYDLGPARGYRLAGLERPEK